MIVNVVQNCPTFTVFCDDVVKVVVIVEFIDLNNVGVIEFGKELHFGKELFFYLLGHLFFLEDLDGPFLF